MKLDLAESLKAEGLFPLELDEVAQQRYRREGIDPATVETHFSPGTLNYYVKRCMRIRKNILELAEMEKSGIYSPFVYNALEDKIRQNLFELKYPTVEDVLLKLGAAQTGVIGVNRDVPHLTKDILNYVVITGAFNFEVLANCLATSNSLLNPEDNPEKTE